MDNKIIIAIVIAAIVVVGAVSAVILLDEEDSDGGTVYYVVIPPVNMRNALTSDEVDGYIAWEPYVSDSVVGDVGEVVLWSHDIMAGHPCCVVAVRNEFASSAEGQELTARFLAAHIEATEWMADALDDTSSADYDALVSMAVEFTMRNDSVVKEAFEHLTYEYEMDSDFISDLEEFTQMYNDTGILDASKITERGYDSVSDFVNTYVNETYLEEAGSIGPSDTILNPSDPIRLGYLLGDLHQLAQFVAQNDTFVDGSKSIFEKYGLNVETAPGAPFANGGAVMTAFTAGTVDIGYLGAPPAILNHLNAGVGTSVIAQANTEGSGIVVDIDAGVDDLKDMVNMTVAIPGTSSIQFLLLKIALQDEGLELEIKT